MEINNSTTLLIGGSLIVGVMRWQRQKFLIQRGKKRQQELIVSPSTGSAEVCSLRITIKRYYVFGLPFTAFF